MVKSAAIALTILAVHSSYFKERTTAFRLDVSYHISEQLKRDLSEDMALSGHITFNLINETRRYEVLYYDSVNPVTLHGLQGLIILKDGRYHFSYFFSSTGCTGQKKLIICYDEATKRDFKIPVSDILNGRPIAPGELAEPHGPGVRAREAWKYNESSRPR